VDAVPEPEVCATVRAIEPELARVLELARVAVRSVLHQEHGGAGGEVDPPDGGRNASEPERALQRALDPQLLFDERRDEIGVVAQLLLEVGAIAERRFGAQITGGNDARLYVQAIYEANKGRPGIRLQPVTLSWRQTWSRREAEEHTLQVYKGVAILAGHAIWIPSEGFVQRLKASGAITSGSTEFAKAARVAKDVGTAVVHGVEFLAGAVVGILEGAWQALVDIFKGAWDLVKMAFEIFKAYLTGTMLQLALDTVDKLKGFFEKLDAGQLVKALGAYIAHRWTDATWYGRGEFVGQVIGYIALNVLLIMATAGGSIGVLLARSAAAGSDVARAVMVLVKVVDVAQNPLKLLKGAGKGLAVGEEVAAKLKQGLPREAKLAAKAEHGAEGAAKFAEDAEAARNINHPGDTPTGGRKGSKPAMTAEAHSLDGLANFSMEFVRDLSPTARGLVRKLEKQGWVRISEIAKDDLVQISKWFGREVAVVQSPYGKLRLVLGEVDGIMAETVREGEVFVVHTHPVMRSSPGHFGKDLQKAGKHIEAAIDWNGQVTYYSKAGIKNVRGPDGMLQPLRGYEAGFIDRNGVIIGFARVDIIEQAGATTIKVVRR
jgi:uncharacterized membrane protein